jgi:hypothetical protein
MAAGADRVAVTLAEWPDDADEGVIVNWFVREGAAAAACGAPTPTATASRSTPR